MSSLEPIRRARGAPPKTLTEAFDRLDEHDDRIKGVETIVTEWTASADKLAQRLKFWGGAVLAALVSQGMMNPNVAAFIKAIFIHGG